MFIAVEDCACSFVNDALRWQQKCHVSLSIDGYGPARTWFMIDILDSVAYGSVGFWVVNMYAWSINPNFGIGCFLLFAIELIVLGDGSGIFLKVVS